MDHNEETFINWAILTVTACGVRRRPDHHFDGLNRSTQYTAEPNGPYLDGHSVAALGGDDAVVPVVVDLVIVDGQEVAVVVGVKAVTRVVVHLVPPPVSLLVAVRVDPEVVVVDVRVIDVAVDVDIIEYFGVTLVRAEPADLV